MKLTDKHLATLRCIHDYMESHGIAPTIREIQLTLGYASNNTAAHQLNALKTAGALIAGGGARRMTITPAGYAALGVTQVSGVVPAMPATATRWAVRHVGRGGATFTVELDGASLTDRNLMKRALTSAGFAVREVARGEEVRRKQTA